MSFLSNLFGRSKKNLHDSLSPATPEEKPLPEPIRGGTTLRKQEDGSPEPQKKAGPELSALEMAERQSWQVKSLPVWKPGEKILGLYRVEDVLEGGMGRVYIAHHKNWNIKLAIKSPNEMMLSDRNNFARVLREANSWTELGLHPNIAYCYYVRSIEDVPHIFVEYVDGGNLRQWIAEGKCIDYRVSLDLAIQFCHGMEHAHSKGMIHRDIKPENVLMTQDGVLKITDFGLVRTGAAIGDGKGTGGVSGPGMTRLGDVMGTEGFMAPEQFEDPAGVDERADIFSFGVCLYEMFCGNRPYSITYGKPQDAPNPVTLSQDLDFHLALSELLTTCVQWGRESRFDSFEEIRQVLAAVYLDLYGQESAYAELELVDLEADGLNNRGVSHLEMGLKERAIQCFQKALEINETHPEATYNLSLIEWRDGIIDDLYVLAKLDCCKSNPANEESKMMELIGYVHLERSDIQSAMDLLGKGNKANDNLFSKVKHSNMMCLRELVGGHSGPVTSVAVSTDSKYVLSASGDRTIFLWDIHSGQCMKALIGHMGVIYSVTFSPDGLFALSGSGGRLLSNQDHTLKLWDLQAGTCVKTMAGHTDDITSVAMCPDGKYAVSGSWDKTLKVWNLSTGEILHTLNGHEAMINAVAITPEGRYVISGGGDWKCRLWDIEGGNCIQTFGKHAGTVHAVAISPNGRYFVCGGGSSILEVWEITAGKQISTLEGHRNGVMSVAISPNGQCVLSGGHDKTLKFWDFETGKCLRTFKGHKDLVRSVAFSPDGKLGVSGGGVAASGHPGIKSNQDFGIRVWKLEPKVSKSRTVLCLPKSFERIRKEREKEQNALGQVEKLIGQTRYEEGFQRLILYWKDHQFSENSKILGLYEKFLAFGRRKNLLASFLVKDFRGYKSGVNVVTVSHDGVFGLSATFNTISIWNISSRKFIRTLELDIGSIKSLALSMDGTRAVLGRQDNILDVWDLSKGLCIRRLEGHKKWINSVAVSPDFKYAVSGSGDKSFRIWDVDKGVCLNTFEEMDIVWSVAITPDGKFALSGGSNKTIKIWDLASGKCLKVMKGGSDSVCALAISPDGRYAMSGHWDNPLKLWDLSTGSCLKTLPGHLFPTKSITFSPDGRYVVSGGTEEILKGYDSTIKIWEIATGVCIANITGHEKSVYSVAVSPDGRRILSGSGDSTVKEWRLIWDLEFPDLVDWDEGIRPYLEFFLTMNNGIWNEADYKRLVRELSLQRGYGWVRSEGIRKELKKLTKERKQQGGYLMSRNSVNKYLGSSFYVGYYLFQICLMSHKKDAPELVGFLAKFKAYSANLMMENSDIEKALDFKSDNWLNNYNRGVYGRNIIFSTLKEKYGDVVSSAFGFGYDSLHYLFLLKIYYKNNEGYPDMDSTMQDAFGHLINNAEIISEAIDDVPIFKEGIKELKQLKILFSEGKYSVVEKNLGNISDNFSREFEKLSG